VDANAPIERQKAQLCRATRPLTRRFRNVVTLGNLVNGIARCGSSGSVGGIDVVVYAMSGRRYGELWGSRRQPQHVAERRPGRRRLAACRRDRMLPAGARPFNGWTVSALAMFWQPYRGDDAAATPTPPGGRSTIGRAVRTIDAVARRFRWGRAFRRPARGVQRAQRR
jgi:hypothetical protein